MTIQPGARYCHNGITVDIHFIHEGQVYYRQWPRGIEQMGMWDGLLRRSIAEAEKEIEALGLKPERGMGE